MSGRQDAGKLAGFHAATAHALAAAEQHSTPCWHELACTKSCIRLSDGPTLRLCGLRQLAHGVRGTAP